MSQKQDNDENILKNEIVWAARLMSKKGYVIGTAGNISARTKNPDRLLITPSGTEYETLKQEDLVLCNMCLEKLSGSLTPSSELPLHTAIYNARSDVSSIIHTHSVYATALAVNRIEIPYFLDEMYYIVGGNSIPTIDYAPSGTEELAEKVVDGIGDNRRAILLSNHGTIAIADTIKNAFVISELIEKAAMIYILAKISGKVHVLKGIED